MQKTILNGGFIMNAIDRINELLVKWDLEHIKTYNVQSGNHITAYTYCCELFRCGRKYAIRNSEFIFLCPFKHFSHNEPLTAIERKIVKRLYSGSDFYIPKPFESFAEAVKYGKLFYEAGIEYENEMIQQLQAALDETAQQKYNSRG